jgi:UDP-galactose transporter B1
MITSNYALGYIDFPTQALVKSAKILPVMAFGIIRKTYDYPLYKYVCAGFITVGLVVFNLAKLGSKVAGMTFSTFGIILLFISLFFDGLNGTQADKDKNKNGGGMFSLMLGNNIVGVILVVGIMIMAYLRTGEILIYQLNTNNIFNVLLISFAGAIGQVLIYLTIVRFDCFILSIVNTSRKFFSILFSVIWFNHPLTFTHWLGVSIVIGAIASDTILSQLEKKKKNISVKQD